MSDAEKFLCLQKQSEKLYDQFLTEESFCGLTSLFKHNKIGSKTGLKIRKLIYEKYGEDFVKSIAFKRTSKKGNIARNLVYKHHSEETKQKIRESNVKTWESLDDLKQKSRLCMIQYCLPKSQTDSAKLNRINSRKWYRPTEETKQKMRLARLGIPLTEEHKEKLRRPKSRKRTNYGHTEETKRKLSEITLDQWKSGIHKPIYKSKGHLQILDILKKLGFEVIDEYVVEGKPFDVFVKDKKLLIEFNGTYWHRDPRFYSEEEGKVFWDRDKHKIDNAINKGYSVKTVWQHDWESCVDKEKLIGDLINGTI